MNKRNYIETCWEEIEKPKSKRQQPHRIKTTKQSKEEKATPLEMILVFVCIVLCLVFLLIGLQTR